MHVCWSGGGHPYVTQREMHGGEVRHCTCDRERWFSDSNHFAISLARLFPSVSAPSVFLLYELTQSKQIYCHNTSETHGVKVCTYTCPYYLQVCVGEERFGD